MRITAGRYVDEVVATPERGWWGMSCWNALSAEQQRFLIVEGYLPFGSRPEGDACARGAEVEITTMYDEMPGPRFYCLPCARVYITEMVEER